MGNGAKDKSLADNNKTRMGCSGSSNLSAVNAADEHTPPGNPPRRGPQLLSGDCVGFQNFKFYRLPGSVHRELTSLEGGLVGIGIGRG